MNMCDIFLAATKKIHHNRINIIEYHAITHALEHLHLKQNNECSNQEDKTTLKLLTKHRSNNWKNNRIFIIFCVPLKCQLKKKTNKKIGAKMQIEKQIDNNKNTNIFWLSFSHYFLCCDSAFNLFRHEMRCLSMHLKSAHDIWALEKKRINLNAY